MAKSTSKLFQSEESKKSKETKEEKIVKSPEEVKEEKKDEPKEEESSVEQKEDAVKEEQDMPVDDIVDIDISAIKKKRFRINGDKDKIIELNTSDLNILSRLTTAYDRLQKYMDEVGTILSKLPDSDSDSQDTEVEIEKALDEIDAKMRAEVDYIFDSPISDKCADGGSMYDPFEGAFRFEHIIEAILKLYERNLDSEFNKMKRRVSAKTSKYVKKYHN